jgi:capsid protein
MVTMFGWIKDKLRAMFAPRPLLLPASNPSAFASFSSMIWDGEKFPGGLDAALDGLVTDYYGLRARSKKLFETNLYARGIVRRLVTNVINTGLHLEATPEEAILGKAEDELAPWSEEVETRFSLWGSNPRLCDHVERSTFGALQAQIYLEALVSGDVLVVLRQDDRTKLTRLQLFSGSAVQSPSGAGKPATGNRIVHGVEIDAEGRHAAYWLTQADGTSKRLAARGEQSGRRQAWLVYGTDRLLDEVRGKPLLGLVLQSLREIDRYRDSTQRKAVINSMIAMFVKKSLDKPGTMPITGGAVRRGAMEVAGATDDGKPRSFPIVDLFPGLMMQELSPGEEPVGFPPHGTDEKFGDFEAAILVGVAWALEIPPEILRLTFGNNYSASQAAINEFKIFLNRSRTTFGETVCHPIFEEWLISAVLAEKVRANGLLEAWRDVARHDEFSAWCSSDWAGHIKPAVDLSKLVGGYTAMMEEGLITRDRASRELTGTKYSKNVAKLARENRQLAEAKKVLAELEKPAAPPASEKDESDDKNNDGDDADSKRAA